MQNTNNVPNIRGIVTQIAKLRGVSANAVYLALRRKSPTYVELYNRIYEERKKELEKFEAYRSGVNNG